MKKFYRIVAIAIVFAVLALVVLAVALIVINHQAIGNTLGAIPRAIWEAITSFPLDWLISGAIGAALAFMASGYIYHLSNKPDKGRDKDK